MSLLFELEVTESN